MYQGFIRSNIAFGFFCIFLYFILLYPKKCWGFVLSNININIHFFHARTRKSLVGKLFLLVNKVSKMWSLTPLLQG
jgi:hypothetical protein